MLDSDVVDSNTLDTVSPAALTPRGEVCHAAESFQRGLGRTDAPAPAGVPHIPEHVTARIASADTVVLWGPWDGTGKLQLG